VEVIFSIRDNMEGMKEHLIFSRASLIIHCAVLVFGRIARRRAAVHYR